MAEPCLSRSSLQLFQSTIPKPGVSTASCASSCIPASLLRRSNPENAKKEEESYLLTLASRLLLKDEPLSVTPFLLAMLDPILTKPWHHVSEWFQNDDPSPFHRAHGRTFREYGGHEPRLNHFFNEAIASDARLVTKVLVKDCKGFLRFCTRWLMLEAGTGTVAKAIADAFPNLRCTVLDLPHVVSGLQGTDKFGGDMFQAIPFANVVLLKRWHGSGGGVVVTVIVVEAVERVAGSGGGSGDTDCGRSGGGSNGWSGKGGGNRAGGSNNDGMVVSGGGRLWLWLLYLPIAEKQRRTGDGDQQGGESVLRLPANARRTGGESGGERSGAAPKQGSPPHVRRSWPHVRPKKKKLGRHTVYGRSSGGGGPHVWCMAVRAEGPAARAARAGKVGGEDDEDNADTRANNDIGGSSDLQKQRQRQWQGDDGDQHQKRPAASTGR
ncbi:hypothetical protein HYC85_012196 [Camellia sinensis]|uniref:O-methyltransferase C-terminal domain-containing protein n=1 Tax=Camellia sinensis TaxID=4442 RepID=A0A7J7HB87_CAMSI|nr:hypothetical protein HYC85_012196 [Camellia sinensis]